MATGVRQGLWLEWNNDSIRKCSVKDKMLFIFRYNGAAAK